jgi:hypothetical protein
MLVREYPLHWLPTLTIWPWLMQTAWTHRFLALPMEHWSGWLACLIGQDFCYYWYHRAVHRIRWFWCTHASPFTERVDAVGRISLRLDRTNDRLAAVFRTHTAFRYASRHRPHAAVDQLSIPVLAPCHVDSASRAVGMDIQYAVGSSRAPRLKSRISRRELRRNPDRVRPDVWHVYSRAKRSAMPVRSGCGSTRTSCSLSNSCNGVRYGETYYRHGPYPTYSDTCSIRPDGDQTEKEKRRKTSGSGQLIPWCARRTIAA